MVARLARTKQAAFGVAGVFWYGRSSPRAAAFTGRGRFLFKAGPRLGPAHSKILAEILGLWPCDAESYRDGLTRNRKRRCDAESQGGSAARNFARCKCEFSCRSASEMSSPCLRSA